MSLLLKNAQIVDKNSPAHSKSINLLIENGKIASIVGGKAKREIDLKGKYVSYGWFDLNAHFCDPGYEHREDIESGINTSKSGGFTDVCLISGTEPPIESKSDVSYLRSRKSELVEIHVAGSISESQKGENLTEVLDLNSAGACCFSDGDQPIWNTELLLKSLEYTRDINVPIFQNARDLNISSNTHIHEGVFSTNLGLRADPSLSEELIVQRDLEVLRYSKGSLHFSRISSAKSVDLIRKAKKSGLSVTCDVGIHHLIFIDESIGDFDSTFKSLPHYRSESDRKALIKGVKDGVIDAICSNHRPLDLESKQLEFDLAEPGNISLQTFYSSLLTISTEIPLEILVDAIVNGPRKVLKKDLVKIDVGLEARLTIFDPDYSWILNSESNLSKSKNSPYWNQQLKGKVVGIVNGRNFEIEDFD